MTLREAIEALADEFRAQGMDMTKGHEADRMWAIDVADKLEARLAAHRDASEPLREAAQTMLSALQGAKVLSQGPSRERWDNTFIDILAAIRKGKAALALPAKGDKP